MGDVFTDARWLDCGYKKNLVCTALAIFENRLRTRDDVGLGRMLKEKNCAVLDLTFDSDIPPV